MEKKCSHFSAPFVDVHSGLPKLMLLPFKREFLVFQRLKPIQMKLICVTSGFNFPMS